MRLDIDVCIFTVESSPGKLTKRMRKQNTYERGRLENKTQNVRYFKNKLIYQNLHSSTKILSFYALCIKTILYKIRRKFYTDAL
jgi:hypothetical protein